jgi:hypothetical protein
MPARTIATLSTFISRREAREFCDNYNANAKGCFSAELHQEADDLPILVLMMEWDTDSEAEDARRRGS